MICINCGKDIPSGAKFCPHCGTKNALPPKPLKCPSCGLEQPAGAKFCSVCGTALKPDIPGTSFGSGIPTPINGNSGGFSPSFSGVTPAAIPTPADYGMNAASTIVAKPMKKSKAPLIIILSCVAALLLILGTVFFFNKGAVINLLMGDSGYAAMLERNSVKDLTALADSPAVNAGLKSAGKTVAEVMTVNNTTAPISSMSYGSLKNWLTPLQDEMDGVSVNVKVNVSLTDTAKSLLSDSGNISDINELLDTINNTSFDLKAVTDDNNALICGELVNKGLTLNANTLIRGNDMYLSFPFGSDKAIKLTLDAGDFSNEVSVLDVPEFDYSTEDFSKLLQKIGDIYIKYYENASVTSNSDGEITASGVSAKGKYILVTVDNTMLKDMFTEILECVADDEPLFKAISECAKESGYELTKQQYQKEIDDIIKDMDFDSDDSFVVGTVLDSKGNVIAKEYAAIDGNCSFSLSVITGKEKSAIELCENGTALFAASINKTSENSGTINAKFSDGNSYPFALRLDYSDVGIEQFEGLPVGTGTYTLSFTPPADFTDGTNGDMRQFLNAFSTAKFTLSASMSGENYIENFSAEIPQYGSASIEMNCSELDMDIPSAVPTDIIDITPVYNNPNVTEEQTQELAKEFAELADELKASIEGADSKLAAPIAELLGELSDEMRREAEPKAAYDDIDALNDRLGVDVNKVDSLTQQYGEDEKANELRQALNDLLSDVWMSWQESMTLDMYNYYISQAEDLETQLENLTGELKKKAEQAASASSSKDYDKMNFEEIYAAAIDLESRFTSDLDSMGDEYPSDRAEELTDDCLDAYNDLLDDMYELIDSYTDGVADVSLLRAARKSAKALDDALTELEKEIYGSWTI